MRHTSWHGIVIGLGVLGLANCTETSAPTAPPEPPPPSRAASASEEESGSGRHIVSFTGRRVPPDFAARVAARGGAVDDILDGPGVAFVSGLTSTAAADLSRSGGIDAIRADVKIEADGDDESPPGVVRDPTVACDDGEDSDDESDDRRRLPSSAACFAYQWNMRAIRAQDAWRAGHLGSRQVRVYLLDTGVDYTKPDLLGLVDLSRSRSVVPPVVPPSKAPDEIALAKAKGVHEVMDFHSHGTAVASTIVSNGVDLAGVGTKTTLVAVKVLDRTRSGLVSTFIKGIYYAADEHADIIHLSLAFNGFDRPGPNKNGIADVDAATTYAHEKGAVIVVAAGNAGETLDGIRWRFCNAAYVICVAATGPTKALSPTKQLHVDEIAPYTNFGRKTVTVTGPGGTDAPNLRVLVNCSHLSLAQPPQNPAPCSTGAQRFFTTGTTFSAAVTSGLAALVISRIGPRQPDRVKQVLIESADHLGRTVLPDDYIGMGRIDAARAMRLLDHDHDHDLP